MHLDELVPSENGQYALVSRVSLPKGLQGKDLEFGASCGSALWKLSVAGQVMPLVVHDDLLEKYRAIGSRVAHISKVYTTKETLVLRLNVSQTWTQSAWFDCAPFLSVARPGLRRARIIDRLNEVSMWMALVTLLIQATYLTLLWLGNKRLRFNGLFAIQIAAASVVPLYFLGLFQPLFGVLDTAVLGLGLAMAIVISVHATNAQYGVGRPGWFWQVILAINILAVVVAGGPFSATKVLAPVVICSVLAGLAHNIGVCVTMLKRPDHRKGATMALLAWGSLLLAAVFDFIPWLGGGETFDGQHLVGLGLTLYAAFQFLGLGIEYLRALALSEELNERLALGLEQAERGRQEIQKLNDELRRQVSERSRQLLAALLPVDEGSQSLSRLDPGELIEGRYKIVREIASGGMGQVFEAVRQDDGRVLAIKVSLELDTNARARIVREAQVASRIVHPNLVSVMDVGVASTGYVYLVMEYVDGTALDRWHQRFGDVQWGLPVLLQIARALSALHSTGLVHRDLKPANVLLTFPGKDPSRPPLVKIGDFGISKSHHTKLGGSEPPPKPQPTDQPLAPSQPSTSTVSMRSALRKVKKHVQGKKHQPSESMMSFADEPSADIRDLTAVGVVLGTPMYVAPELASPWAEITPAADMYSFGVLVFNLLGRSSPFVEPLFFLSRAGQSYPPPCSIATVCPNLPEFLVEALDSCLSTDPVKRPSARRMGELLERAIEQLSTPPASELS